MNAAHNKDGNAGLLDVALMALVAVALLGCESAPASPTPSGAQTAVPATSSAAPASAPPATPAPAPTIHAFPTASEVALNPGRYDSSPPFDIDFTFQIPDEGWHSAHLNAEFFDVMRFDGPDQNVPTRWIAWAHPATVHGATSQPAPGLTPQAAADLISTRSGVHASPTQPFSFAGLTGVVLDLTADAPNTHIFGGPDGNFGMEPAYALRMGLVEVDSGLLLVLCLAAADELDAAWDEAQPILSSAQL